MKKLLQNKALVKALIIIVCWALSFIAIYYGVEGVYAWTMIGASVLFMILPMWNPIAFYKYDWINKGKHKAKFRLYPSFMKRLFAVEFTIPDDFRVDLNDLPVVMESVRKKRLTEYRNQINRINGLAFCWFPRVRITKDISKYDPTVSFKVGNSFVCIFKPSHWRSTSVGIQMMPHIRDEYILMEVSYWKGKREEFTHKYCLYDEEYVYNMKDSKFYFDHEDRLKWCLLGFHLFARYEELPAPKRSPIFYHLLVVND